MLAVHFPSVVAFPLDWQAALVFDPEMGDAAFGSQDFECAPAGG